MAHRVGVALQNEGLPPFKPITRIGKHRVASIKLTTTNYYKLKCLVEPEMEHIDIAFGRNCFLHNFNSFGRNVFCRDEEGPVSPTEALIGTCTLRDADANVVGGVFDFEVTAGVIHSAEEHDGAIGSNVVDLEEGITAFVSDTSIFDGDAIRVADALTGMP